MKCSIRFLPDDITIEAEKGVNLLKSASMAGIDVYANCGGQGICGRCKIIIKEGNYSTKENKHLSLKEKEEGCVISCLTSVEGDMVVEIPSGVRMREGKKIALTSKWKDIHELLSIRNISIYPPIKKIAVDLRLPTLDDNINDLDRLKYSLSEYGYDSERIRIDLSLIRSLPHLLRKREGRMTLSIVDRPSGIEIVDIMEGDQRRERYGIAIDLGTTTLVTYIVDLIKGRVISTSSCYNSQMKHGDDVISRIVYTEREDGLNKLNGLVIADLNRIIEEAIDKAKVDSSLIDSMVISGNTTMTHLFFKVDPKYIREEPYIPAANHFPYTKAGDIGLSVNENTVIYAMPGVASYVGGDITSGVLSSGLYRSDELSLFIDIGTNGEIVLGNSEWLMTTACSAGPCFEGGGVKHGMRATDGAIEQVIIDPETLDVTLSVIGNVRPSGICGSGMIDAISEMFLTGIIDSRGKIQREKKTDRVREGEDGIEFILAYKNESDAGDEIVLTEPDIDNIIRAKAAIYAGFSILLKEAGLEFRDVKKIMIAGGFGKYINVERAIIIGLLPDLPSERFIFLGNTSITGSYLSLLSHDMKRDAEEIANNMTYIELSVSRSFMDEYVSSLFLPHTNISEFPRVKELLAKGNYE